jgi:hypothetical protein
MSKISLTLRFPKNLRDYIESQSKLNQRSLNQEIITRIENSFLIEDTTRGVLYLVNRSA